MVCLALALSAIVLAAPGFAIVATLAAGKIGACFAYQAWGSGWKVSDAVEGRMGEANGDVDKPAALHPSKYSQLRRRAPAMQPT
jgi:hypothetical protein